MNGFVAHILLALSVPISSLTKLYQGGPELYIFETRTGMGSLKITCLGVLFSLEFAPPVVDPRLRLWCG
jgi:hypothetical protein